MTLPVFQKGTQPSTSYASVTINTSGWTQLWGADLTRSFAAVLAGTGTETVYITANPAAAPTDPDVAAVNTAVRGACYFETRGTNALYARISTGSPLLVRTTIALQVPKSPQPSGVIGTKNYKIVTSCGGGTVTYTGGVGGIGGAHANVLPREDDRIRTTIMGNTSNIMLASNYDDPQIIPLITVGSFTSSGPFFPGPLPVEGVDAINLLNFNNVGQQTSAYFISDKMVVLP